MDCNFADIFFVNEFMLSNRHPKVDALSMSDGSSPLLTILERRDAPNQGKDAKARLGEKQLYEELSQETTP